MSDEEKKLPPPTLSERADPGGEMAKQVRGLSLLGRNRIARTLLKWSGVPEETLDEAAQLAAQHQRLVGNLDAITETLSPLGWPYFEAAPHDEYVKAAELVEAGRSEEAVELILDAWNGDECAHLRLVSRVFGLYSADETTLEIAIERDRLLTEAVLLHSEGRFAGAISIALAQAEGIFLDFTGKSSKQFFDTKNDAHLDDVTLAGHPLGLREIARQLSAPVARTSLKGRLLRHGILHGRELAYDTRENSTRALVAARFVIEAMKPRADELNERRIREREVCFTGVKGLDENGRYLDRRGFQETKDAVWNIQFAQVAYHRAHDRFTSKVADLRPLWPEILEPDQLDVSADGCEYRTWLAAPTGTVFGIGAQNGDAGVWMFVGDDPPRGSFHEDDRWRHSLDDDDHVEF